MSYLYSIPPVPFKKWIWQDKENTWYMVLAIIYSLGAFVWLKIQYPFPSFLPDSYSYLDAAYQNLSISTWPVGYSEFLRLFSSFTRSDTALIFVQYMLLQGSILYFLLTIRYLLSTGKWVIRLAMACCILSPLTLFLSNFISSDALFASLSLIWCAQLLWILHRPGMRLLIFHAVVLLLAFKVRYNALFYPLISISLIMTASYPLRKKGIAIGCILLMIGGFVARNLYHYKQLTGHSQFSAFGGWQLASNALFAYSQSSPDPVDKAPEKLRFLHAMVNQHIDSLKRLSARPDSQLGIYYLWDEHAPLKRFAVESWKRDTGNSDFQEWASMGPIYSAYGTWLIARHPVEYMRYFVWPNMVNYYVPQAEFMGIYNMGKDSVDQVAKNWFAYKTNKIAVRHKKIPFVDSYPIVLALVNLLFVLCFLSYWLLGGFSRTSPFSSTAIKWIGIVWSANFVFSVLASPIVLRYQVFPMIITAVFTIFLFEFIMQESFKNNKEPKNLLRSKPALP